jgi:hypothetical protein
MIFVYSIQAFGWLEFWATLGYSLRSRLGCWAAGTIAEAILG